MFAPANTPAAAVQRAAQAVREAVAEPDFVQALTDIGMVPRSSTPEALAAQLRQETEAWGPLVRRVGFTADS